MANNVSKELFEANAALNAQEFANRQILVKGDGLPTSQAPQGAKYMDKSVFPPITYTQIDVGVGSNWIPEGQGEKGVNGAVFITDVEPQNPLHNVGQKVFSSDGKVLDSALTNTDLVKVTILAALGHTNYKPSITVLGNTVNLSQDEDQPIWQGTVDIDLDGATKLIAEHEDGAKHEVDIVADQGAEIVIANFTGGYPNGQSEVKEDDSFFVEVNSDSEMARIEVLDYGAAKPQVFDFAPTNTTIIEIKIADQGESPSLHGVKLRAMNTNGSFGEEYNTEDQGSDEGVHVVRLNNFYPSGIIDAVEYPVGQVALKDNEIAKVDLSGNGYDEILYSSPNGQLQIANPDVFQPFKEVVRISGDYNVSQDNIRVTMTKISNGAITIADEIVQIADSDPVIRISEPATRLRSGGNNGTQAQNHEISLISDQELLEAPTITAPHGTLLSNMIDSGNKKVWNQSLRVHDDDQKGIFQFGLTEAKNLAGRTVNVLTGDADYELGGFVSRVLVVPAFQNELDLEVNVADTSKVVARDKDSILLTYKNNLIDELKTYSITAPSQTLNVKGNLFFWADQQAVNNNTTGLATITVEEIV
ncbi:MAG: hypothetical protein RJQ00_06500 [Vicingaceae bacterium]